MQRSDQESIQSMPHLTQGTIRESDKTGEYITYKRAKKSALSQQVTTRLQGTDKSVLQTNKNNNNYP